MLMIASEPNDTLHWAVIVSVQSMSSYKDILGLVISSICEVLQIRENLRSIASIELEWFKLPLQAT